MKKAGFTLAEVLITLGVIGVVASLTIPALIQNAQNQALKSQLKKSISVVESAFRQAALDNGGSLAGFSSRTGNTSLRSDDLMNFIEPYFSSVLKKCNKADAATCCPVTTPYKTYSGGDFPGSWSSPAGGQTLMVLKDGTILYIFAYYPEMGTCTNTWLTNTQDVCAVVGIDTNGVKGPNKAVSDLFQFYVKSTGALVPLGTSNDIFKDSTSKDIGYEHILEILN